LRSDIGLSAKQGTVIRENPTRLATYNPTGGGFHRLVETGRIRMPEPDIRPSLVTIHACDRQTDGRTGQNSHHNTPQQQ